MPTGDYQQHTFSSNNPSPVSWTKTYSGEPIQEKTRAEIMNERADLATRLAPFVSQRWIMTKIFGLSESEAEEIEMQRRAEATKVPGIGHDLEPLPPLPADLKRLAMGVHHAEDDDVAYFQRNMMKALKIPESYLSPGDVPGHTVVGPNDYLIVHVKTDFCPADKIEAYLRKVKASVREVFKDAPFVDRMVFVAGATQTRFSSIRVETQEDKDRETQIHAMHAYAKENSYWIDGTRLTDGDIAKAREILRRTQKKVSKQKFRPPIM